MQSSSYTNANSLHTINDIGAKEYITENLEHEQDENIDETSRLLPPDVPGLLHEYNTTEHTNGKQFRHQYFIHRSTDDVEAAVYHRDDNEKCGLSPVRRMFCLLAVFDASLTFLMWLLYLQVCFNIYIYRYYIFTGLSFI